MTDSKRSATVEIYTDASKETLIAESPVIRSGALNPDRTWRKATDAEVIEIAKRRQIAADGQKAEGYFYCIRA